MRDWSIGQRACLVRGGKIVDRGVVKQVIEPGNPKVEWERTTIRDFKMGDDVRPLYAAEAWLDFLDLEEYGLNETEFRLGKTSRLTAFPWAVIEDHKQRMREWLEARRFNIAEEITAQEQHNRDVFLLRQEFALP